MGMCVRARALKVFCRARVSCVVYVRIGSTQIRCVVQGQTLTRARKTGIDEALIPIILVVVLCQVNLCLDMTISGVYST